ncbi:UNKNOWN [Stylonychia lemnae]|uniref:Tudor domain-containing protein n=1 Tax=Stylonychia lemnae TaxID=5949 RepID=A0A078AQ64_STYLE|nr:UNKNOWN [Stylonychia lemnae]|eukprot:CDW84309.1 UNKNOWN [Stylonychia lemnae]
MTQCKFKKRELTDQLKIEIDSLHLVAKNYPEQLIGKFIYVYWENDNKWYAGQIRKFSESTRKFSIVYDDNQQERLDLTNQYFFFDETARPTGKYGKTKIEKTLMGT